MAKYSFQDIRTKKQKKLLKNEDPQVIPPVTSPAGIKSQKKPSVASASGEAYGKLQDMSLPESHNIKKSSRIIIWGIAILAVVLVVLSLFGLFSGATIKISPKQQDSVIDGVFKAMKETSDEGGLSFQVMVISAEENKKVSATEEKRIDKKAFGTIIVYNSYSSSSQRLIKNTRFESPEGKIYRIKGSITVPGSVVASGELVPGSVEVVVYADEPGENYNTGLTDFTIPGFKGDPRYGKFYARSKTDIAGGFSGMVKVPADDDMERAKGELKTELESKLLVETASQKPNGFVLYEDAKFITYDEEVKEEYSDDFVELTLSAKLYGVIFNEEEISKFIAEQSLAPYDGNKVEIPELENLSFKIQNKESISPFDDDLRFSMSGSLSVIWMVDEGALKEELAGSSKKEFENTMATFPNITKAGASIRPFWKRSFPEKEKRIKVEVSVN